MKIEYLLNSKNYITYYYQSEKALPCIVIAPGGGYEYTSIRESECVAKTFNDLGYHAIVVNYRETLDTYPYPGLLITEAVRIARLNEKFTKIIGLGFSAGGHALLSAELSNDKLFDLLMLAYPVITSNPLYYHMGSFKNLLGNDFSNLDKLDSVSLEKHLKPVMPDLFLWHTMTDQSVSVMNSILLLQEYEKNNFNCEFHVFCLGGHGLSLANEFTAKGDPNKNLPYISRWIMMAKEWLELKLK